MKRYSLIPLEVARNPLGGDEGFAVLPERAKQPVKTLPVFIFYIQGPKQNIIIDCGKAPKMPPYLEELLRRKDKRVVTKTKGSWRAVVKALAKVALKPEDIDIVIVTHAHQGHMGYIKEYPRARFYVQKEELEFSLNPLAPYANTYLPDKVRELEKHPRLQMVDGDVEVVPGVGVLKLPGHTPGMQAVAVETAKGVVVYASDLVYSYRQMYPNHEELGVPLPYTNYLPPKFHLSLPQCHASFERAFAAADILLPAHDEKIVDGKKIPPEPFRPLPQ